MATTAATFFPTMAADDQAFSGEATIRAVAATAIADNVTTTQTWTATALSDRTVIPGAGSTAATDTTQNNGWAFNNGGADGIGSVSDARRFTPAGVWNFSVELAVNSPALLASIPTTTLTAKVYRVATGGGTRTLLFSTVFATFTASGIKTVASASQPMYTLEPGEVVMVGYLINSGATAATVLGAITDTVWTWTIGSDFWFQVPSPGVRTAFDRTLSDGPVVAADSLARSFVGARALTENLGPADDSLVRSFVGARALTENLGPADDSLVRSFVGARALTENLGPADDSLVRSAGVFARNLTENLGPAADSLVRVIAYSRNLTENLGPADDVAVRQVIFNRSITENLGPADDSLVRSAGVFARNLTENLGPAADSLARSVVLLRRMEENLAATCPPCPAPGLGLVLVDGELAKHLGGLLYTKV